MDATSELCHVDVLLELLVHWRHAHLCWSMPALCDSVLDFWSAGMCVERVRGNALCCAASLNTV